MPVPTYRQYMSELIEIDLLLVQEGFGTMTWPDGDSYVGAWEGGSREGWGAYYWNNGNSYQVHCIQHLHHQDDRTS